jgi:hypothetical protein
MCFKKKDKGWRGDVELGRNPKHDPQEDDPKLGPIIKQAREEARYELFGERSHKIELGDFHAIWGRAKQILKAQGIDWKTPAEMNPHTMYD